MLTNKTARIALLLSALGFIAPAIPASAQETTAPKSSSDGQQQKTAPKVDRYGDWSVACGKGKEGNGQQCISELMLVAGKKKDKPVLVWRWRYDKDNKLKVDLAVATGLRIDKGIMVGFDAKAPTTLPYEYCNNAICGTTFPITEAQLRAAASASDVKVTVVQLQGKPVDLKVSMKGLTDSLRALKAKNAN